MKKYLLSFLILFFLAEPLVAEEASEKKIVILGDSISDGYGVPLEKAYPFLLEQKLNQKSKIKIKVISSSVSGSTTASGPSRVPWILKSKPNIVIIALGANDGLRGFKVVESQKNIEAIIELLQKSQVKIVIAGMKMPPNYGRAYTDEFYKMFIDIKAKYKLPMIPFLLEKVGGDKKFNQDDGIHPNEAGHKIIADTVYTVVKDLL